MHGRLSGSAGISGRIAPTGGGSEYPIYDGAVTVTPSAELQTLQTAGKVLLSNIKVDPIPQNYGLITWNGSFLTIS